MRNVIKCQTTLTHITDKYMFLSNVPIHIQKHIITQLIIGSLETSIKTPLPLLIAVILYVNLFYGLTFN